MSSTTTSVRIRVALLGAVLALFFTACAPRAGVPGTTESASQLERTALVAYHRMQIGYLETGSYTTNVLVDLELPRGVRWTLEAFSEDSYRLRFVDDANPSVAVLVGPQGVEPVAMEGGG